MYHFLGGVYNCYIVGKLFVESESVKHEFFLRQKIDHNLFWYLAFKIEKNYCLDMSSWKMENIATKLQKKTFQFREASIAVDAKASSLEPPTWRRLQKKRLTMRNVANELKSIASHSNFS